MVAHVLPVSFTLSTPTALAIVVSEGGGSLNCRIQCPLGLVVWWGLRFLVWFSETSRIVVHLSTMSTGVCGAVYNKPSCHPKLLFHQHKFELQSPAGPDLSWWMRKVQNNYLFISIFEEVSLSLSPSSGRKQCLGHTKSSVIFICDPSIGR